VRLVLTAAAAFCAVSVTVLLTEERPRRAPVLLGSRRQERPFSAARHEARPVASLRIDPVAPRDPRVGMARGEAEPEARPLARRAIGEYALAAREIEAARPPPTPVRLDRARDIPWIGARPGDDAMDPVVYRAWPAAHGPAPRGLDDGARADRGERFENSYYYLPAEPPGPLEAPLYDARCAMIALVPRSFHDDVCVQGSGRLVSGEVVSFVKRDCACAAVCPRTGQHICFDKLEPSRYPSGRGATGRPIRPLSSVAVDTSMIPLASRLFIQEFVGMPRPNGSPHDGCFVAEDRGLRVVGRHVDVFTGDIETLRIWNAAVPTRRGVHVRVGDPRCAHP
jgi:3D (Asp-Asp-Asp) domain-containing protein